MFGMLVIRNSLKLYVLELATCMFIFVTIVCVYTLEVVCVCSRFWLCQQKICVFSLTSHACL